ncbi:unnamed protein product [Citrullus colocynthis]|uniref:Transmembrane protein n=1 Tax=Citrullus colocynthis TaxID=252529 RepID=A0ABP0YLB3_9ROSI
MGCVSSTDHRKLKKTACVVRSTSPIQIHRGTCCRRLQPVDLSLVFFWPVVASVLVVLARILDLVGFSAKAKKIFLRRKKLKSRDTELLLLLLLLLFHKLLSSFILCSTNFNSKLPLL